MAPSGEYAGQIKLQAANSISLPHTHGAKLLHSPTRTQTHRQTFKNNPSTEAPSLSSSSSSSSL